MSRTLSRVKREAGISLEMPQWKRASSRIEGRISWCSYVVAGNLGFLSSYEWDLRDTLVCPQESPVSMRVARVLLGFLSTCCWVLGPHVELRSETQVSFPVLTWISVFVWSFYRGVRPRLLWRHASPLSSQSVRVDSGFLSS